MMYRNILLRKMKLKQKQHLILNQLNNTHYNETKFKEKIKELVQIRRELEQHQKNQRELIKK